MGFCWAPLPRRGVVALFVNSFAAVIFVEDDDGRKPTLGNAPISLQLRTHYALACRIIAADDMHTVSLQLYYGQRPLLSHSSRNTV